VEQRRKWTSFGWERPLLLVGALAVGVFIAVNSCDSSKTSGIGGGAGGAGNIGTAFAADSTILAAAQAADSGRKTFRYDTFGDEAFWGGKLRLHEAIAGSANGGVGPGVSPETALAVGLKVDAEAVPAEVAAGIKNGTVDLKDPKTTLALLKLNAVVGVTGFFTSTGGLQSMGIQCALCHSTVDDSFTKGIGKRLDGWPNHDLNPGMIISLSPALDQATKDVYASWGPGKYDPRYNLDGVIAPPAVIPPAYGLLNVNKVTATGDGNDLAYWNRYVSVTQMGGHGSFMEPRTGVSVTHGTDDQVSSKLHHWPPLPV